MEKKEVMQMLKNMKELLEAQEKELGESRQNLRLKIAEKRRWQLAAQGSEEKVRILNKKVEELEEKVASLAKEAKEAQSSKGRMVHQLHTNEEEKSEPEIKSPGTGKKKKACRSWLQLGICDRGSKCEKLHSRYTGNIFSMVANFEAPNSMAIYGIALPCGTDKLYACGNGGSFQVWDCHTGHCIRVIDLMAPVRCIATQGNNWVFLGSKSALVGWNTESDPDQKALATWNVPVGQIYVMEMGNGMLFAGAETGKVAVFRCDDFGGASTVTPVIFQAHSEAVMSLVFEPNTHQLYTGSSDSSIKVWSTVDRCCFSCIRTLSGHKHAVTSLAFWGMYLLSGSLDRSVKVWANTGDVGAQLVYTQDLQYGSVALKVIYDAPGQAFLLCSCNDDTVRLYDLPRFTERGEIFAKDGVVALSTGPAGTFFTGDFSGELTVWKMNGE